MTLELFFSALLGLALQGLVIYGAIRAALVHDRASQGKADAVAKQAAAWKARRAAELAADTEVARQAASAAKG